MKQQSEHTSKHTAIHFNISTIKKNLTLFGGVIEDHFVFVSGILNVLQKQQAGVSVNKERERKINKHK